MDGAALFRLVLTIIVGLAVFAIELAETDTVPDFWSTGRQKTRCAGGRLLRRIGT